jgi:hypothetical protein
MQAVSLAVGFPVHPMFVQESVVLAAPVMVLSEALAIPTAAVLPRSQVVLSPLSASALDACDPGLNQGLRCDIVGEVWQRTYALLPLFKVLPEPTVGSQSNKGR